MNEDTVKLDARHDVTAFVAAVRSRLADLTEEEREELLGGLEADLSERLAEGEAELGAGLGDPVAYAAELRAAAGLEARPRDVGRSACRRPEAAARCAGHGPARRCAPAVWTVLVGRRTAGRRSGRSWSPCVRCGGSSAAWIAAQLLDIVTNGSDLPTIVPTLLGLWPGILVTVGVHRRQRADRPWEVVARLRGDPVSGYARPAARAQPLRGRDGAAGAGSVPGGRHLPRRGRRATPCRRAASRTGGRTSPTSSRTTPRASRSPGCSCSTRTAGRSSWAVTPGSSTATPA